MRGADRAVVLLGSFANSTFTGSACSNGRVLSCGKNPDAAAMTTSTG
ncbi:hypothetical protein MTX20_27115 [Bradyrhizobium sp. ISRA435]|nr:hypothetical protein MTX20_27115 [Bradyrhizobium sp. ISRA435]